jgi:hypothetical protein
MCVVIYTVYVVGDCGEVCSYLYFVCVMFVCGGKLVVIYTVYVVGDCGEVCSYLYFVCVL